MAPQLRIHCSEFNVDNYSMNEAKNTLKNRDTHNLKIKHYIADGWNVTETVKPTTGLGSWYVWVLVRLIIVVCMIKSIVWFYLKMIVLWPNESILML